MKMDIAKEMNKKNAAQQQLFSSVIFCLLSTFFLGIFIGTLHSKTMVIVNFGCLIMGLICIISSFIVERPARKAGYKLKAVRSGNN